MLDPGLVVMPRVRSQCLRLPVGGVAAALDRGQVGGHFRKLAAALKQRPFDPPADIRGLDDPTGRVADALAQLEGVREAAVADRREAGGQVGDDLVGLGASRLAVAEEPVVRQREELPGRVAGGGIELLRDRLRVLAGLVRDGERERAAAVRARRHLGRDVHRLAVERDRTGRRAGRDGADLVALAGSSSVRVAEPAFATQTWPSAATAMPLGCLPTGNPPSRCPLEGSIFDTVPSAPFATHTASEPTATAAGSFPTLVVPATVRAAGSMRERTPADRPITQTLPSPAATPSAPSSTEIGGSGVPVTGSMRMTVRSTELATHTAPRP